MAPRIEAGQYPDILLQARLPVHVERPLDRVQVTLVLHQNDFLRRIQHGPRLDDIPRVFAQSELRSHPPPPGRLGELHHREGGGHEDQPLPPCEGSTDLLPAGGALL